MCDVSVQGNGSGSDSSKASGKSRASRHSTGSRGGGLPYVRSDVPGTFCPETSRSAVFAEKPLSDVVIMYCRRHKGCRMERSLDKAPLAYMVLWEALCLEDDFDDIHKHSSAKLRNDLLPQIDRIASREDLLGMPELDGLMRREAEACGVALGEVCEPARVPK